uniref:podocalyxin n=1 Tax=Jaculus jaculus TaxID=51337 RepID=UPI001E1AFE6F|nr:podocalyxin [Jaculus jaculus]
MRSRLARSARPPLLLLLLLLVLSPPSLSLEDAAKDPSGETSATTTKPTATGHQDPPTQPARVASPETHPASAAGTTLAQPQGGGSTASTGPVVTTAPAPPQTSVPPSKTDANVREGIPTGTVSASQDDKLPTTSPTPDKESATTGDQSSDGGVPTAPGGAPTTLSPSPQPTDPVGTTQAPPLPTLASTASPGQPPEATSEGQLSLATVASTSGPASSPALSTASQRAYPTPTLPGISEETELTSRQMPAGPTQPFSTAPQPTGLSAETGPTPTIGEPTNLSTISAPTTTPEHPSTPSPTSAFGKNKVKCDPAIRPDEKLLILNLTEARLCDGSPSDDKLVSLLCRSVKASFNPAKDQCTVQVAPLLESHAVAVKRIIIETMLPPQDVYELLKNKWDELKEVGVTDIRLGHEGPPDDMNEDRFSMPLIITIVCMASFLLLVAAVYGCCHQRLSQRKDQQRLTEELQTVENGYHDNPTLEVMETSSEMQEKKMVNLNGELGDSWIVPLDNLTKDELDEEEDTHL